MSEEAELPQDTPSSAGNKMVAGAEEPGLEAELLDVEEAEERETPSWNTDSAVWLLLGV